MRNLIILGTGRSGTSMAAALFRKEPGVFFGFHLLGATAGNRHGYYEDEVVNAIYNLLVKRMLGASLLDGLPAAAPTTPTPFQPRFTKMVGLMTERSLRRAGPARP